VPDESKAQAVDMPEPGPPFRVGERVAFAPTVIGPTRMWLAWEEAVILRVDQEAVTFEFRHISEPEGARHSQGLENVVRVTDNYRAWRSAWEASFAKSGDEATADRENANLWLRVLAEHPMHGADLPRRPPT
jgi:hypothetical protein